MKKISFQLVFFSLFFWSITLWALRVDLPNANLGSKGILRNRTFSVLNETSDIKAVEISIATRKYSEKGIETRKEVENHVTVFPQQAIIQPGDREIFVLRYVKKDPFTDEQAYRVIVEEIHIPTSRIFAKPQVSNSVTVLTKFVKSLYIVPSIPIKASLRLKTHRKVIDSENNEKLSIIIENRGTQHIVVAGLVLELKDKSPNPRPSLTLKINPKDIPGPNILAKETREVLIDWPTALDTYDLDIAMKSIEK